MELGGADVAVVESVAVVVVDDSAVVVVSGLEVADNVVVVVDNLGVVVVVVLLRRCVVVGKTVVVVGAGAGAEDGFPHCHVNAEGHWQLLVAGSKTVLSAHIRSGSLPFQQLKKPRQSRFPGYSSGAAVRPCLSLSAQNSVPSASLGSIRVATAIDNHNRIAAIAREMQVQIRA